MSQKSNKNVGGIISTARCNVVVFAVNGIIDLNWGNKRMNLDYSLSDLLPC